MPDEAPVPDHAPDPRKDDHATLRQKLHWATGDREKEAEALAERTDGEVTSEEAERAVHKVHGDSGAADADTGGTIASTQDAEAEHGARA
jgi:hypothetical protein